MTAHSTRQKFRELLKPGAAVLLPGVSNALAARVVADLGFPAAYITGAGIANSYLGFPDNGLVTLTELTDHVATIREVFPGPLMVDGEIIKIDAVGLHLTGVERQRAVVEPAGERDRNCGHASPRAIRPAKAWRGRIIRYLCLPLQLRL